jgi:hypothetical protein
MNAMHTSVFSLFLASHHGMLHYTRVGVAASSSPTAALKIGTVDVAVAGPGVTASPSSFATVKHGDSIEVSAPSSACVLGQCA